MKSVVEAINSLSVRRRVQFVNLYRKIYNDSCTDCKKKILSKNGDIGWDEFCSDCQPMIEKYSRKSSKILEEYSK